MIVGEGPRSFAFTQKVTGRGATPVDTLPPMAKRMSGILKKLARLTGRTDLSLEQLQELEEPIKFLFSRLAVRKFGELSELALFTSTPLRTSRHLQSTDAASGASRLSTGARAILPKGRKVPRFEHVNPIFKKCYATILPCGTPNRGHAVFLWGSEVFEPAQDQDLEEHPELVRRLSLALQTMPKKSSLATTLGQLRAVVPARHKRATGYLFPSGSGFERADEAPADRPCIDASLARSLAAFFYDEPLLQAYSRDLWILVAPKRVFSVFARKRTTRSRHWLQQEHEAGERKAALKALKAEKELERAKTQRKYERKRRAKLGLTGKPEIGTPRKGRLSAAVTLESLNRLLDAVIRLSKQRQAGAVNSRPTDPAP